MHNPKNSDSEDAGLLDYLGAEPLAGSGFEDEQLEPGFHDRDVDGAEK